MVGNNGIKVAFSFYSQCNMWWEILVIELNWIELNLLKLSADVNKTVFQAASIIRNEIKSMKDTMPWPPQACNLTEKDAQLGPNLGTFMNVILSGKLSDSKSARISRLKLSLERFDIYCF